MASGSALAGFGVERSGFSGSGGFVEGRVAVRLSEGAGIVAGVDGRYSVSGAGGLVASRSADAMSVLGVERVEDALWFEPSDGALASSLGLDRHRVLWLSGGVPGEVAAAALEWAGGGAVERAGGVPVAFQHGVWPDEPGLGAQWGLIGDGPDGGIGVEGAWDRTVGSPGVTVAVLDAGVSADHPDLAGRQVEGADMLCPPQWAYILCVPGGTDDQVNSHGTHIAGIIGAVTDNGAGVSGVDWNARLMPVRVLSSSGSGSATAIGNGVVWAADQGADVISISIGLSHEDGFLRDAISYAVGVGSVVVASSGNGAGSPVAFPARHPGVIAVGAVDGSGEAAWFNSVGPELSVTAPGVDVYSTWDAPTGAGPDSYEFRSGTSMAAPHVAGVVSLMLSMSPVLSPEEVRAIVEGTAWDLGAPGWDPSYGHGVVDALGALRALEDGWRADFDGDGEPDFGGFDVNGDGMADIEDLYAQSSSPADVNRDGEVDLEDTLFLLEWVRRDELQGGGYGSR